MIVFVMIAHLLNGIGAKLLIMIEKLQVRTEEVQHAVEGVMFLLTESSKLMVCSKGVIHFCKMDKLYKI